jgi:hypothetical protein
MCGGALATHDMHDKSRTMVSDAAGLVTVGIKGDIIGATFMPMSHPKIDALNLSC